MFLNIESWTLPLRDPVFLFASLFLVILTVPDLLQRYRIPGIVGLILMGAILGPHGINLLERGEGIKLLGSAGLLYIMFWAGLEINLSSFLKNKHKSAVFGLLTFGLPLSVGFLCSKYLLGFDNIAALLMASMFSTHTLLSYPIVTRLRISQIEAVTITVGGTIITDTLALLLLAVASGMAHGKVDGWFWLKMVLSLAGFFGVVFGLLPKIARWYFRKVESDLTNQFVFALTLVFFCGILSQLAGIEPIIGAFMAGLVLNRLIPHASPLMDRIEFVGEALFIPAFLFSVGMLINLQVFLKGGHVIYMALLLTAIALLTKWLAAQTTSKIFQYKPDQANLIFGLSSSHAAATIAIIMVGYQLKLFDEAVLNSIIFLILATCLVSTFVTDRVARKIAAETTLAAPEPNESSTQRIIVPYSNPATVTYLIDFAILLKLPGQQEPIYPLSIILDGDQAKDKIRENLRLIEPVLQHAARHKVSLMPVNRVDVSSTGGILLAAKELLATEMVIGWHAKMSRTELLFGTLLDNLLPEAKEMVFVSQFVRSPFSYSKVKLAIAPGSHLEPVFTDMMARVEAVCQHLNAPVTVVSTKGSLTPGSRAFSPKMAGRVSVTQLGDEGWWHLHEQLAEDELLIIFSACRENLSYLPFLDRWPDYLSAHFAQRSFVLVFPGY